MGFQEIWKLRLGLSLIGPRSRALLLLSLQHPVSDILRETELKIVPIVFKINCLWLSIRIENSTDHDIIVVMISNSDTLV